MGRVSIPGNIGNFGCDIVGGNQGRRVARLAEATRASDFGADARAVDAALAKLDRREAEERDAARRARVALLEAGIEQEILRRDAPAVARRVEALVAVEQPNDRPAWQPGFRKRLGDFADDGDRKGFNFLLTVATELARRMEATSESGAGRGTAAFLLAAALAERAGGRAALHDWRRQCRRIARRWRR